MKFQFNVKISEQDYLNYNVFHMMRSPYGKRTMVTFRVVIAVLMCLIAFIPSQTDRFSAEWWIGKIPVVLLLVLFQVFFNRLFIWSIKGSIRSLKKRGKAGYTPDAVLEFYEDEFREITEETTVEHKYSVVERISVVDNKILYIHINNVAAYLLPLSCFESLEQYDRFLEFMKLQGRSIDQY